MKTRITNLFGLKYPIIQGGKVAGLINDIPTCSELIERITSEAEVVVIRERLESMLMQVILGLPILRTVNTESR